MRQRHLVLLTIAALMFVLVSRVHAAVDVNFFNGSWQGDVVVLAWESASELDIAGFQVWRSDTNLPVSEGQIDKSQATSVGDPIPAQIGCGGSSGAFYSYTDPSVDPNQPVYYYYLEVFDCSGGSEFYDGNESGGLRVAQGYQLLLPLLVR